MSEHELKEHFQQTVSGAFPTRRFPYEKAAVLILYWAEDDFQPPCEGEAREVRNLFSHKFRYDTEVFRIPTENSRNALEKAVVDFKYDYDASASLMIVYYSGHGDPDDVRGKAVWAAKRQGNPTIDWFEIQPHLENAHADVLLIFDCCHASLAAKARKKGTLELLAASSAGGVTPCPGKYSFTRYLKDELEKALVEKGSLQVNELHARINRRVMTTTRITPVHFTLRSDPLPSIILRPLSESQSGSSPLGAFTFTVSVLEAPSKHNIRQLGEWMKRTAPNTISAVRVDRVVDLSTGLQGFLLDDGKAGVKGRFVDTLAAADKDLVLAELRELGHSVADARVSSVAPSAPTVSLPLHTMEEDGTGHLGAGIFQSLERVAEKLFRTTWTAVSRHPAFQSNTGLEILEQNQTAQQAGISAAASMSLLAQEITQVPISDAKFIPWDDIVPQKLLKPEDQFSLAMEKDQSLILEIIRYSPEEDGSPPKSLRDQFPRTCSLLARPKPDYYRILRGVGYTQDKHEHWYGLAFEIPKGYSLYSKLDAQFRKCPRVPWETRYRLAYSIALSLYGLHSVHWVHKGIRSENILFFAKSGDKEVELDQPWLFGFEYTRETAAASSQQPDFRMHRLIYLPPSRWGAPSAKFSYEHDIYTLGVLLLEIGFWRSALRLNDRDFKNIRRGEDAQAILIKSAGSDLSHAMGSKFSHAVMACLTGQSQGQEGQQTDLRKDVVDVLEELAT